MNSRCFMSLSYKLTAADVDEAAEVAEAFIPSTHKLALPQLCALLFVFKIHALQLKSKLNFV